MDRFGFPMTPKFEVILHPCTAHSDEDSQRSQSHQHEAAVPRRGTDSIDIRMQTLTERLPKHTSADTNDHIVQSPLLARDARLPEYQGDSRMNLTAAERRILRAALREFDASRESEFHALREHHPSLRVEDDSDCADQRRPMSRARHVCGGRIPSAIQMSPVALDAPRRQEQALSINRRGSGLFSCPVSWMTTIPG